MHSKFATRALYLQVRDVLSAKITSGVWEPGSAIPNEIQLAQELGVSQGTTRKALDQLEAEKIVVRKQGRGTFVVDHASDEMAIRFSSIYNEQSQRIAGTAKALQPKIGLATQEEQLRLELLPKDQVYRVTRERWYHDHPFMFEHAHLPMRRFPGLMIDGLSNYRISAIAQKHGIIIEKVVESVEAVACPAEPARHLGIETGSPVLFLNRIALTVEAVPVEWRKAWCHLREKRYISIEK